MAFLPNIPLATDQLSVSQGNINNNFGILGAIAGNANVASASLNTNSGFNFVYLSVQAGSPPASASFPAGAVGLYSFNNATTTQNEFYINKTNFAGVAQIPISASILGSATPLAGARGYSYLPSGIILQWGQTNSLSLGANGSACAGFAITFPTRCMQVLISPQGNGLADQNTAMYVYTPTTTNFGIWLSVRDSTIGGTNPPLIANYLAIGY